MGWLKLDDQIPHHVKFLKAGPDASWLWVCCLAYCQRHLTDGFVPTEAFSTLGMPGWKKALPRLVAASLVDLVVGGYRIHDYLAYNSSRSEVLADREWDRRRKELYADPALVAQVKVRDQGRCRYCGQQVNFTDRRGPSGGQFDHVEPRGPNTLDNIVVACRRCNICKNGRTPDEAGMPLLPPGALGQNRTSSEPVPNQNLSSLGPRDSLVSYPIRLPSDSHPTPVVGERAHTRTGSGPLAGSLPRDHLRHAFCGRVCLPEQLFGDFCRLIGGDPQTAPDRVRAFCASVDKAWSNGGAHGQEAIGDDVFGFWRARWAEQHGTTRKSAADIKREAEERIWAQS